jgi:FkbM family methyltransferase
MYKKEDIIFLHSEGEHVSDMIRHYQTFYEIDLLKYIELNYKDQNEIIDVGANIGNHSYFFAKYLNCKKVHAFEPIIENIDLMLKTINPFIHKIIVYPFALSNKEGEFPIYNTDYKKNYGRFTLDSYYFQTNQEFFRKVKTFKLDQLKLDNISMIKIDVENHENEVLEGAKETIERNKPIIFVENINHHNPHLYFDKEPHKKILESYNYKKLSSNIGNTMNDLWVPNI